MKAVAATTTAFWREIPYWHVGVRRCIDLLERKKLPRHPDAALAELAVTSLSQDAALWTYGHAKSK